MAADNLEQWLENLPLDEPVDIDGETVFLKLQPQGAELGVYLVPAFTGAALNEAMRSGFQCALDFHAGLSVEGPDLLLTQWLPQVESWLEAAEALESILNQTGMWRALMVSTSTVEQDNRSRSETRVRKLLSGG